MKKETKVVHKIVDALNRECSGLYFKVHGNAYQEKGIPDILGCCKGYFIAIEVKTSDKDSVTSSAQDRFLKKIQKKGKGFAIVARTPQEATTQVNKWIKENVK